MPWLGSVSFRPSILPGRYSLGRRFICVALRAQRLQITQGVIVAGDHVVYVPSAPSAARTASSAAVASVPQYSAAARLPVCWQSLYTSRPLDYTTHLYHIITVFLVTRV